MAYINKDGLIYFWNKIKLYVTSASTTGNAATATKATNDSNGNSIVDTYAKKNDGTTTGTLTAENITVTGTLAASLTGNADTATKATNDSSGNSIVTTYATKASDNQKVPLDGSVPMTGQLKVGTTTTTIYTGVSVTRKTMSAGVRQAAFYVNSDGTSKFVNQTNTNGTIADTASLIFNESKLNYVVGPTASSVQYTVYHSGNLTKVSQLTNDSKYQTDTDITSTLATFKAAVLLAVHPIGSLYWSEESTDPGTLFGGTWEAITGKFIYAVDGTHAAGATGGEATHTLTVAELPSVTPAGTLSDYTHDHGYYINLTDTNGKYYSTDYGSFLGIQTDNSHGAQGSILSPGWSFTGFTYGSRANDFHIIANTHKHTFTGTAFGSNAAHNNMPPWEAAYCWKRTA